MLKSCKHCGRIVPRNHICPNKPIHHARRTEEEQGRYTHAWNKKSVEIKEQSQYLCATCRDKGIYTYDGLETHHIVKLRDRPDLLLEDSNLICLCQSCHERAERGEYTDEYLYSLVAYRMNKYA